MFDSKNVNVKSYADNSVLINSSEDNPQRLLYKFNMATLKCNMTILTDNTKRMVANKNP